MSDDFINIAFDVEPTGVSLPLTVMLDNNVVWHNNVDKKYTVQFDCSDDERTHVISLQLDGKMPFHTVLDHNNNIVKDNNLIFSNFVVDDIDISQLIFDRSKYQHNFNSNGQETVDRFFGVMGCNGLVSFEFSTPFYIWLLENM